MATVRGLTAMLARDYEMAPGVVEAKIREYTGDAGERLTAEQAHRARELFTQEHAAHITEVQALRSVREMAGKVKGLREQLDAALLGRDRAAAQAAALKVSHTRIAAAAGASSKGNVSFMIQRGLQADQARNGDQPGE